MPRTKSPYSDKLSIKKWRPPAELQDKFDETLRSMLAPTQPGRAGLTQNGQVPPLKVTDSGFQSRNPFG